MMKQVYLDYGATTPIDKRVFEAMAPFFSERFGNASSIHGFGRSAKDGVERARERIAQVIRADPAEIYFTGSGTESDNWALKGYALANRGRGDHIITSAAEHHAVLETCDWLEESGYRVTRLPVDDYGFVSIDDVSEAVTDRTILISVMHVNNEIGTINDIQALGSFARSKGIAFHTDAVQSFGKIPVDVNSMNIDLLTASAHKIYGPKGTGMLYVRKGVQLAKYIHGGAHERGLRAGTENVPAIVGFGIAAKICRKEMKKEQASIRELYNYFRQRVVDEIPRVRLNGHPVQRLAGNLNVSFADADGESILLSMDLRGIAASSGAACTAGGIEPSHVIRLLKLPQEYGDSSVRFTLGRYTTRSDIDYTVDVLKEVVERIRGL